VVVKYNVNVTVAVKRTVFFIDRSVDMCVCV
jgi:hypothetical protein